MIRTFRIVATSVSTPLVTTGASSNGTLIGGSLYEPVRLRMANLGASRLYLTASSVASTASYFLTSNTFSEPEFAVQPGEALFVNTSAAVNTTAIFLVQGQPSIST